MEQCIITVMTAATEDWSEAVTAAAEPPTVEVKLFGKWNPDEVHVNDISLAVSVFVISNNTFRPQFVDY